jgi:hypothetical protein
MTPRLGDRILAQLKKGYGAEDIALRLKTAPELVRREIARLRQDGRLQGVWPRASQDGDDPAKVKRPGTVLPTPTGPNRSA